MSAAEAACPKCGRPARPGDGACPRCGLLVERWEGFRAPEDPDELDSLWSRCREAWEDEAVHDRLLDAAARLQALPALARRYRQRLDESRDDAMAGRRLAGIAVLLETSLRAQSRAVVPASSLLALRVLGYLVVLCVMASSAWFFLVSARGR